MRGCSLVLIVALWLGAGCGTVPIRSRAAPAAGRQLSEAFRVALAFITQRRGAVVVVLPTGMNERTRRAIRAVCDTVERKEVPATEGVSLPGGYFLLEYTRRSRGGGERWTSGGRQD
jgi:hypothetical protein